MADDWKVEATKMFHDFQKKAEEYGETAGVQDGIRDLVLIFGSKAVALSELLEKFGAKPEV